MKNGLGKTFKVEIPKLAKKAIARYPQISFTWEHDMQCWTFTNKHVPEFHSYIILGRSEWEHIDGQMMYEQVFDVWDYYENHEELEVKKHSSKNPDLAVMHAVLSLIETEVQNCIWNAA